MDKDYRELLRRLFVAAVEITETAHEAAAARRLRAAARDIAALAEAAAVIAGPDDGEPAGRADPTP